MTHRDQSNKQRHRRPAPRTRAMTLVEILAVVVILGLIAGVLTLSFRGQIGRAKRELAKTGIGVVVSAIETYAIEQGRIPSMQEGLHALTQVPQGRGEPYLKPDKLFDPWRRQYQYVEPSPNGGAYLVLSLGADGRLGGAPGSDDEDISSDTLTSAHSESDSQGGAP